MTTTTIASLDSKLLARRLRDLMGEERNIQVDFLLHLDEYDRRRAYLEEGFGSLWDWCLRSLHLREGAAGRRIAAMKVLRRFPRMEGALRDGRLCLSTLALLGQVLTEENADELLARAAYLSKAEVDSLVVSVKPRPVPTEGIRKLAEPRSAAGTVAAPQAEVPAPLSATAAARSQRREAPASEMRAVSEDLWSLRVTVDREFKDDLEKLAALLSHRVPRKDVAAVLHEAVRCAIDKHGKRKGAVGPARRRSTKPGPSKASSDPRAISIQVRRQVWERDGGCCTWTSPEGHRCNSRWQLELDHIESSLRGGESTTDNLRLRCRAHNLWYAEQVYGREHMDRFRRQQTATTSTPRTGELADPGDSWMDPVDIGIGPGHGRSRPFARPLGLSRQ